MPTSKIKRKSNGEPTALAVSGKAKKMPDGADFEVGKSGTPDYNGYISQDYNPEFNGRSGVTICDKMRKTDGTVAAALRAVKYPLMASEWIVESADRADDSQNEIAEFVRENLFDRVDFPQFIREAMGYLDFGFWYFEKVYEVNDGKVMIKKLASRLPTAHEKWSMASKPSEPGVTQLLPSLRIGEKGTNMPEIPMSRLVLFTNEREGDNYAGTPLLRSAYKHFFMKDQLYRIDATKHERGAGILKVRYPNPSDRAQAEALGENFNINEQMYIAIPGVKPEQGQPGWDVEMLTSGIADQSAALMESVKHHDRMIVQSILASFMDLGSGSSGSFALGGTQKDFFGYALKAVAEYVGSAIGRQMIVELVDMNYGKQKAYPRLKAPMIGQMDRKAMAEVLGILNAAGLLEKDYELKSWVTKAFGLPERTAEDIEDAENDRMEGGDGNGTEERPNFEPQGGKDEPEAEKGTERGQLSEKRWRRPLTAAEKRVKFAEVKREMDDVRDQVARALDVMTAKQKSEILDFAGKVIEKDDIAAVRDLIIKGDPEAEAAMQDIARRMIESGKIAAADELGVAAPATSAYTKKAIKAKVALYIANRNDRLAFDVKSRLIDILNGDAGKAAGLFEIEKVIADATRVADNELIGQVAIEPLHEGRYLTFEDAKAQIHGMQRSEILDDRSCNICLSLDGRVLPQSDPMTQIGAIHENCAGMWVAILKTDSELPEPKPLPKSIQSRFDLVGGVPVKDGITPMSKPVLTKDSRAMQKINDGELEV